MCDQTFYIFRFYHSKQLFLQTLRQPKIVKNLTSRNITFCTSRHICYPPFHRVCRTPLYARHLATKSCLQMNRNHFRTLNKSWIFHKSPILLPINSPSHMPVAHIGGLIASALARLAKIRYLFLMGTAAGGASAYQVDWCFECWSKSLLYH